MPERWQNELLKVRQYDLPASVLERAKLGSSERPGQRSDRSIAVVVVALAAVVGAGVLLWRSFGRGLPDPTSTGTAGPPATTVTVTPGPPSDFTALWPERSRAAAEEAQAEVDSGRDRWRRDAFATAARYASHVLGWLGADPQPCFVDATCAGSRSPDRTVYVYQSLPCDVAGNPDCRVAVVHLERLIRAGPTGIWSVTDVEVHPVEAGGRSATGRATDIVFVLKPEYRTGETVEVKIRNVGTATYLYQSIYQACFLTYIDASGREFIIPPGTHCDILSESQIAPGETRTLFRWELDECTKDAWGCQESAPLPPGVYTIQGSFVPKDGGTPAMAEINFRIRAGASSAGTDSA